MDQNCWGAAAF